MSWEWDTDEDKRKETPAFYGYISKKSLARKAIITASLFVCSICCLLTRSLTCVCLEQKGLGVVAAVLASEMVVYFVAKAFADNVWYWLPMYGFSGCITAFIGRFVPKILDDWTFFVQLRIPTDVGGVGFCLSLTSTVVIGLALAITMDEIQGPFEKATLMKIMIGICISLLVPFAVLLCAIDQKYLSTFISTKTANTHIQEDFTKNEEDEKENSHFRIQRE